MNAKQLRKKAREAQQAELDRVGERLYQATEKVLATTDLEALAAKGKRSIPVLRSWGSDCPLLKKYDYMDYKDFIFNYEEGYIFCGMNLRW